MIMMTFMIVVAIVAATTMQAVYVNNKIQMDK